MKALESPEMFLPILLLVSLLIWGISRWALTQKKVKESQALTNLFSTISTASIDIAQTLQAMPVGSSKEAVLNTLVSQFISKLQSSGDIKAAAIHPVVATNLMKTMVKVQLDAPKEEKPI